MDINKMTKKQLASELGVQPWQYDMATMKVMYAKKALEEKASREEAIKAKPKEKLPEMTGADYASSVGLGPRASFFLVKKYGHRKKSLSEWESTAKKDGLI